jgi:hypothetical protein
LAIHEIELWELKSNVVWLHGRTFMKSWIEARQATEITILLKGPLWNT